LRLKLATVPRTCKCGVAFERASTRGPALPLGSLIFGREAGVDLAAGDALGYPVGFQTRQQLQREVGPDGTDLLQGS
jgi:hypothetical protein